MKTDGAGHWRKFLQVGDQFLWDTVTSDFGVITNPGTAATVITLNVPAGIRVTAVTNFTTVNLNTNTGTTTYVSSLDQADVAPAAPFLNLPNAGYLAGLVATSAGQLRVQTNTSSQVRCRVGFSDNNVSIQASTIGWIDRRGQDD
jgi:hypothetical protein